MAIAAAITRNTIIGSLTSSDAEQPPPPRFDGAALAAAAVPWPLSAMVQLLPATLACIATLPLLLCLLAAGIERIRGGVATAAALGAAAWTVAVTALLALRPDLRYDIAADLVGGRSGAIWEAVAVAFRVNPALLFPSLVRGAPQDFALAAAWIVLLLALVRWGARPRTAY